MYTYFSLCFRLELIHSKEGAQRLRKAGLVLELPTATRPDQFSFSMTSTHKSASEWSVIFQLGNCLWRLNVRPMICLQNEAGGCLLENVNQDTMANYGKFLQQIRWLLANAW